MCCSSWRAPLAASIINSLYPSTQYSVVAKSLDLEQSKLESGFAIY